MDTCRACHRELHYLAPRVYLLSGGWVCSEECAREHAGLCGQLTLYPRPERDRRQTMAAALDREGCSVAIGQEEEAEERYAERGGFEF